MRTLLAVVAVSTTLLLAGCSGSDSPSAATPSAAPPSSSSAPSSGPFTPAPAGPDVIDSETCAEVRAGIDAFNLGDFDETVAHFQDAVPLAEADDDGSPAAAELEEAIAYYADLDPGDYLEAAESSPDFAKYKAITLSQCAGGPVAPESSSGVQA